MRLASLIKTITAALCLFVTLGFLGLSSSGELKFGPSSALAQSTGSVPGNALGNTGDAEFWRVIKQGVQGQVSIPDKKAGVLVQPFGDEFRKFRNETQKQYGAYAFAGTIILLIAFYLFRGKIMIAAGLSGKTVSRFNDIERFSHWLMASSFIYLAVTGLITMYGSAVLTPVLGKSGFAVLAGLSKVSHNFVGFAFMVGLALSIVLWIKGNIPNMADLKWLSVAGGMLSKDSHPAARKFNAGQKILFWAVSLGGISASYTGLCLLMPFEFAPFEPTFAILNSVGFELPTSLSPLQETQYALLWHGIMTVGLTVLIVAHIYIGSIGMEGAFDAISTGEVDENWAHEHHSLWLEELKEKEGGE